MFSDVHSVAFLGFLVYEYVGGTILYYKGTFSISEVPDTASQFFQIRWPHLWYFVGKLIENTIQQY